MDIACDVNTLFHEEQGTGFRVQGTGYRAQGSGARVQGSERGGGKAGHVRLRFAGFRPPRYTDFLTPPHPLCYKHSTPFKSNPERLKKVAPMTVKIGSCRPKTKDLPR